MGTGTLITGGFSYRDVGIGGKSGMGRATSFSFGLLIPKEHSEVNTDCLLSLELSRLFG
jgi:hypothetical protein